MVTTVDLGDSKKSDDIPQMPLYDGGNFDTPVNAVSSEEKINQPANDVSAYGDYGAQDVAPDIAAAAPPYQPYGGEAFPTSDQANYGTYNTQQAAYGQGGVPMSDNNGFGGYGNGQQNGGSYDPNMNYGAQGQQGYQDPYGYGQGYQNQDYQNQGYDAQGYQQGYQSQQGYDAQGYQPGYQSQQSYDPQGYQPGYQSQQGYPDQGYQDQGYQAQDYQDQQDYTGQAFGTPGQEQAASASSSSSLDDEWFNNILGVDGAGEVVDDGGQFGFSAPQAPAPQAAPSARQQAQYGNPGQSSYRPAGTGPSSVGGRPGAPRKSPVVGGSGGRSGGGRKMKLNRNGYMFLAFVAILIICIIIVIALIARGCSKKPAETTVPTFETSDFVPTSETTKVTIEDKSAPMGVFIFSDSVGYRTWWDLFHYVYKIDLDNESDPRIQTIIKYNGLDPAVYTPHSGDRLLLPPLGVIAGTIPVTFKPGGAQTTEAAGGGDAAETTQATEGSIKIN